MSRSQTKSSSNLAKIAITPGVLAIRGVFKLIYMTFISGPRLLVTSELSAKNGSLMILLSIPALLFCAMLTIPALLFPSPQQNAYFHFARVLNHDPSRWFILSLAGVCSVLALAMPANDEQSIARRFT